VSTPGTGRSHRVLVTGAAGFVGSNLVEELLAQDYAVVGIDNLLWGSMSNLVPMLDDPGFHMIEADIRDDRVFSEAVEGVDIIVHLAAMKIPKYGNAKETLLANAECAQVVLDAAVHTGARVVTASTSDVYGLNPDQPLGEDSRFVLGSSSVRRWAYSISKLFDESLFYAYGEEHGVDFTILRFFGSYGPRHHRSWWGGPQTVFIDAALAGEKLPVHGDGTQRRCFTYASDLIDGIARVIGCDACSGEAINLGNPAEDVDINELATIVCELTGRDPSEAIHHIPHEKLFQRFEEIPQRIPDITKAMNLLDYDPKISLRDGLARTIEWHRANPVDRPGPNEDRAG
jgi:UDP-glucose 4-epimerase